MERIPEQTSRTLTARFYDSDTALTVPASVRYRIDDEASGTQILGWTSVTPATVVTISLTVAQNTFYNRTNRIERRIVTVQTPDVSDDFIYEIARLDGLN